MIVTDCNHDSDDTGFDDSDDDDDAYGKDYIITGNEKQYAMVSMTMMVIWENVDQMYFSSPENAKASS